MNQELKTEVSTWLSHLGLGSSDDGMVVSGMVFASLIIACLIYLVVKRGVVVSMNIMIQRSKVRRDVM